MACYISLTHPRIIENDDRNFNQSPIQSETLLCVGLKYETKLRMIDRTLLKLIASDVVIDQAYAWLCQKRSHYHFNNDVWQVRRWWEEKKPQLQALLRSGGYQFRELRAIWGQGQTFEVWSALDALVLKAMAIVLTSHLISLCGVFIWRVVGG